MSTIPKSIPRTNSLLGRMIGTLILKLTGWTVVGAFPDCSKFVAAVAPHTSNWDFVIAIGVKLKLGIKIQFLGKHSIFVGPLGWLLRRMGGIPVERSAAHGMVEQISARFSQQDALILGIAPEGTRKYSPKWKSGFLHIAKAAQVPVVPMILDYRSKQFVILPAIFIQGDIDTELQNVQDLYVIEMAKYPQQVSGDMQSVSAKPD
ncbi:lysophospholipid acyltransferase family protein [Pseudoalteromonas tunicata]|nr:lysophospholipid acyltransferase family protein [Pseudoalteromonas tunicata]MDP4984957.1 lysophospholipid acyltransferase family protein [Pseudoalteromonas tunicata]